MEFVDFKNSLKSGKKFPVYVLEGEDAFFSEQGLCVLKQTFIQDENLDFSIFDGTDEIGKILSSLNSVSFFGGTRMTAVRDFYPKADELKRFGKFFDGQFEDNILVIINKNQHLLFAKYSSVCIVNCNKAETSDLVRWIKKELESHDISIGGKATQMLIEYCMSDMSRIKNETQKFISLIGKGGNITENDVEENVSKDADYKIYELTDLMAKKKPDFALEIIDDLLGKGETPLKLISSIYNYYRRLLFVAISDMNLVELSKTLGIKEFAVKKIKEQSANFKKRALKSAVDILQDADYKIKSGKVDADTVFNYSVMKIISL